MIRKTITIDGRDWVFRWNYAAQYQFEAVTSMALDVQKTLHRHVMYWCMLRTNNEDFDKGFDDFVEELNEHPELAEHLDAAFLEIMKERAEQIQEPSADDKGDAKKKS